VKIETKVTKEIKWVTDLRSGVNTPVRAEIRPTHTGGQIGFSNRGGIYINLFPDSLADLYNFYRDLGELLDYHQPGLVNPLPDGDPSEVDAMRIIYEADQLRRGIECAQ
jgi:hypothetical protein